MGKNKVLMLYNNPINVYPKNKLKGKGNYYLMNDVVHDQLLFVFSEMNISY